MDALVKTTQDRQGSAPAPLYTAYRRNRRTLTIVALFAAMLAGATIALVLALTSGGSSSAGVRAPGAIERFHADANSTGPDVGALQRFHADAAGK